MRNPAIYGDSKEDGVAEDVHYSETQSDEQKISELMLSWCVNHEGESLSTPKYDKEVPQNHNPLLRNETDISGELSAASPGHLSMASPPPGGARIVDPVREFGSPGLGNVAWKGRVDGWKMKQEKPVIPMTSSHPPSERGVGDIEASTDVLIDDSLLLSLSLSIFATGILEMRWSGVGIDEWWRNEQFLVIGGVSARLFAVFQGLLKVLAGIDRNFNVTSKAGDEEGDFTKLYMFKWTILIPPTTLLIVNLVGVARISYSINSGYQSWAPLFGKLFFTFWVIMHLYPFLIGLMGR